jgi:hypothetical protein
MAAQEGHLDCLSLLKEAGADVESADAARVTPLEVAERNGHTLCVTALTKWMSKPVKSANKRQQTVGSVNGTE